MTSLSPPFIHSYIYTYIIISQSATLVYPIVSFHGLSLLSVALFLVDAAAIGGVCCRGLCVKVCLSGPKGKI